MPNSRYFKSKSSQFLADFLALAFTFATLTLILTVLYRGLVQGIAFSLPHLFTTLLPRLTLALGACVIFVRHPVHALLCLIVVFFDTVLLYLAVESEFLALVFLIVYVGAIAILFLFVIRLLNVKELRAAPRRSLNSRDKKLALICIPLTLSFAVGIPRILGKILIENDLTIDAASVPSTEALEYFVSYKFHDIRIFSNLLYTYYSYLFRLTALLLLTSRLGAIILATRDSSKN